MLFGEKLKTLRVRAGLTQEELAESLGITTRTLINYEGGKCYPKQTGLYKKIANTFSVSIDGLMSDSDYCLRDAEAKGGRAAVRDVAEIIGDVGGLFSGGELSEDDKDKVLRKITELYWKAKEENKKYAAKRVRSAKTGKSNA